MRKISEYFVPYNKVEKLQKLGFDEPYIATTDQTNYVHIKGTKSNPRGSMIYDTIECPLLSQAFNWFRENYWLTTHVYKPLKNSDNYSYDIFNTKIFRTVKISSDTFDTYEEAELACLDKLIEIAENERIN